MEATFRSVCAAAEVEIERKRSRFIGIAAPVHSAAEAEAVIGRARERYPDATHHCYAYRADLEALVVRMSDAGEPQGTAGRPILEVLERNALVNVCVVVVRYFGGTLLGAAGLVRAYSAAAAEAVERAGIVPFALHAVLSLEVDYADWPRVERALRDGGAHQLDLAYEANVAVRVAVLRERSAALEGLIRNLTAGRCVPRAVEERYLPTAPTP